MSRSSRAVCLKGLYLILDESWSSTCSLADMLAQASIAGVRLMQYRNKSGSMHDAYQQAIALREVADRAGMIFIVNDRCDLARAVRADGVHLGQTDLPLNVARRLMGPDSLIGISTHRREDVLEATRQGADYLGFGPIFPTSTKKDHDPIVGIEGLQAIRSLTTLPIFAIGGIRADVLGPVLASGADGVAVASAILGSSDVPRALQEFMSAFG